MVVKIKKQKAKKSVMKRKLKFENYKNCFEATQLENKISYDCNGTRTHNHLVCKRALNG